jgi:hypothetical protein
MFEDGPMSQKPEDGLERMFAAAEAAIRDDGFTQRVVEQVERADKGVLWRRTAIYGAGLAGAGFAVGGIFEMAPHLPKMSGWFDGVVSAVSTAGVEDAVQNASDATQLAIVAVLAGVTFLVAAVTLQNR